MKSSPAALLTELLDNIENNITASGFVLKAAQDTKNEKWEAETKAEIVRLSQVMDSYQKQINAL